MRNVKDRKTIRKYSKKEVDDNMLRRLLETAAELRANAFRQLEKCGLAEYGDFAFIGV